MIYELRKLAQTITQVISGKAVHAEPNDRKPSDASRALTPQRVDEIMSAADAGDAAELFRLAAQLPEKNWDIFHALQTRHNAVLGCPWSIEPGDDTPAAKAAAEKLEKELKECGVDDDLDSFYSLLSDMMRALLPGIVVSEIVWAPGGSLAGFNCIEPDNLTLRDGRIPKLITQNYPLGIDLQRGKFIVHSLRTHGPDPVRGGLIRPLAWLHCFANLNVKDLLNFIERYGMPFTVARVDQNAWDTELGKLKSLIRNFGPNGGGIFTKSTEIELLQAANNTGEVYFKLLEYCGMAITKVVLGQTATAGDGGGWSNNGAQSQVRQDILEADCNWIENTLNVKLCAPWAKYNCADGVPDPRLKIDSTPAEDIKLKAEVCKLNSESVNILTVAGYELDPEEITEKTGFKVVRSQNAAGSRTAPSNGAALTALELSAETLELPNSRTLELPSALDAWLGPLADAIGELADDDSSDAEFAKRLDALSSPDKLDKFDSKPIFEALTINVAEAMKSKVTQASSLKDKK